MGDVFHGPLWIPEATDNTELSLCHVFLYILMVKFNYKVGVESHVVAHACNLRNREAEAGVLQQI